MVAPQSKSTDAGHRGGLPRSSDEVSVMEMELRRQPVQSKDGGQPGNGRNLQIKAKPFYIPKQLVYEAFKRVKANKGVMGLMLRVCLILSRISATTFTSFGIECLQKVTIHHR